MPQNDWRAYLAAGAFLLVVVFVAFYGAYLGTATPKQPPHQEAPSATTPSAERGPARVASVEAIKSADERIADYTWWVGAFTLALALVSSIQIGFLIRADRTARISADAAKKSADAAVAVERPRVFLASLQLVDSSLDLRTRIETPMVNISFHNYGRSPAFLSGSHFHLFIGRTLPATPEYDEGSDRTEVIEPHRDLELGWMRVDFRPTTEQVDSVIEGKARLWMYGVLVYEDFAGDEHETGFCGSWVPRHIGDDLQRGFSVRSRSPYIYRT